MARVVKFPSQTKEYAAAYRARNRERIRAQARACYWRKVESERARQNENGKRTAPIRHEKDPRRRMLVTARHRAKREGLPFDLSVSDFSIPEFCPALGIPLRVSKGRGADGSPSLDKIVPERGYVRGNVEVISLRANRIKYDANYDELARLSRWLNARVAAIVFSRTNQ